MTYLTVLMLYLFCALGLMKTMDNLGGFVAAGSRDCAFWAIVIIAYFSGSIMILRCEGWITDLHAHL
ncbi:hypothetical protein QQP08_001180 [Theobroma cacao]|nr:hypothetical protein QQP08_001180 [Theobroma cacao]